MEKIRIFIKVLVVFALLSTFFACESARFTVSLGPDGDMEAKSARGDMKPERMLKFRVKQARTNNLVKLEKQIGAALDKKDTTELKGLISTGNMLKEYDPASSQARNSTTGIYIRNRSGKSIEILDGPFAGQVLGSSRNTDLSEDIPEGICSFPISTVGRNNKIKNHTISRVISDDTEFITIRRKDIK